MLTIRPPRQVVAVTTVTGALALFAASWESSVRTADPHDVWGWTVTAAVLLARTTGSDGEPGMVSGRSSGASRRTVTERLTGSTRTPTSMPG